MERPEPRTSSAQRLSLLLSYYYVSCDSLPPTPSVGTGQGGPIAEYAPYLEKIAARLAALAAPPSATRLLFGPSRS
jgi:hypothetical protein